MMRTSRESRRGGRVLVTPRRVPFVSLVLLVAGCGTGNGVEETTLGTDPDVDAPRLIQAGAPGQPSRTVTAEEVFGAGRLPHTQADVRFMSDMILHHGQAIQMVALVPERSEREEIRLMARRIDASQMDEINLMRRWLESRGEEPPSLPDPHSHHGHGAGHAEHGEMPGMLSPEQMERLAAARGEEFERLFLESMVFHHEGAITMVAELFSSPGAAQQPEMFEFASHVDSDQRMEIERMQRMLREYR